VTVRFLESGWVTPAWIAGAAVGVVLLLTLLIRLLR
jgi:hypothetical protein